MHNERVCLEQVPSECASLAVTEQDSDSQMTYQIHEARLVIAW